ncbi:MAG: hypothetical protein ACRYHA_23760 [Janthinobacterium lividum]
MIGFEAASTCGKTLFFDRSIAFDDTSRAIARTAAWSCVMNGKRSGGDPEPGTDLEIRRLRSGRADYSTPASR